MKSHELGAGPLIAGLVAFIVVAWFRAGAEGSTVGTHIHSHLVLPADWWYSLFVTPPAADHYWIYYYVCISIGFGLLAAILYFIFDLVGWPFSSGPSYVSITFAGHALTLSIQVSMFATVSGGKTLLTAMRTY